MTNVEETKKVIESIGKKVIILQEAHRDLKNFLYKLERVLEKIFPIELVSGLSPKDKMDLFNAWVMLTCCGSNTAKSNRSLKILGQNADQIDQLLVELSNQASLMQHLSLLLKDDINDLDLVKHGGKSTIDHDYGHYKMDANPRYVSNVLETYLEWVACYDKE